MVDVVQQYREQLEKDPADAEVFAGLAAALLDAGDWLGIAEVADVRAAALDEDAATSMWVELVEHLEARSESLENAGDLARLAHVSGVILEQRLGELEHALLRYQRAFELDTTLKEPLAAARDIYRRAEEWESVVHLYNIELENTGDVEHRIDLLFELAELCTALEATADALTCVQLALAEAPDDPRAAPYLALLESVEVEPQGGGDLDEVRNAVEALLNEAAKTRDGRKRTVLRLDAAERWIEAAADDEAIEELLESVLKGEPRNQRARELLQRYYEANDRWSDLVAFIEQLVLVTPRKSDKLELYARLAEVAREQLEDYERAANWQREVLKLDPVNQDALNFCVEVYSAQERWHDLVSVYEMGLRARGRGGDDGAMLVQIAMILWKKVSDLNAAENYFKRVKLNNPKNRLMLDFYVEFYRERRDWKRLLATLQTMQAGEDTLDGKVAVGLQMAEVAEQTMNNREKAIDIWKSLLKLTPGDGRTRIALRRLYSETKKWNALLEFLKEDLGLCETNKERIDVHLQMIAIYRDQLNLDVMVVNTYNQILHIDPTHGATLDALESKFAAGGRWNDLIGILGRRVDAASTAGDADRQVELHRRIAGLWLEKFSNPNQATKALERILELRSHDARAIQQLIDIFRSRRDWKSLFDIYGRQLETLEGVDRVARLAEMAKIAAEKLTRSERAVDLWKEVLSLDPTVEDAWRALETLYQKAGRWTDLAEHYGAEVERTEGVVERVTWLKKLGVVQAERLEDEDRAAEAWHAILRLVPGDGHAEASLRQLYLERADWAALERLYADRGDFVGFVRLASRHVAELDQVAVRIGVYKQMARVLGGELDNEALSVEAWQQVLVLDDRDLDAASALRPYYEREGGWDDLVRVLEVILGHGPEEPIAVMLELAAVHEDKRADAAQAYLWHARALEAAPERESLLGETQRAAAAADVWEAFGRLLEVLVEAGPEVDVEARLRRQLADACARHLGRDTDAVVHYQRVRELAGDRADVLEALRALYEKLSRWDDLLALYDRQIELAGSDAAEVARILEAIAGLHESVRDDAESARATWQRLRELDAASLPALHGLQRIAEMSSERETLVALVEAELALTDVAARQADLLYRLGILAEAGGDIGSAMLRYGEVLARIDDHPPTIETLRGFLEGPQGARAATLLEAHVRTTNDAADLCRILELQICGSESVAFRAERLREIAGIEESRLADADAAFATWIRLLDQTPSDASVRSSLERLAGELDRWGDLAVEYGRFAIAGKASNNDSERSGAYSRLLAQIQEERLGDYEGARSTLRRVLEAEGDQLSILDDIDRLTTRLEDWRGLVDVCESKLAVVDGGDERVALLFRIGDLWEEVLESADEAIAAFGRVLEAAPGHDRAETALERIYTNEARWPELASFLEARIAQAAGGVQLDLIHQLGNVLEHELGAVGDAIERYATVLETDDSRTTTIDALEAVFERYGDASDDSRMLRARSAGALDPVYRRYGQWPQAIQIARRRLADADAIVERVGLHSEIARIYEYELDQSDSAFAAFAEAVIEDYGHVEVRAQLERLAAKLDGWQALTDVMRGPLEGEAAQDFDPELRRSTLARLAEIFEVEVNDDAEAIKFNRRVLDEDSDDTAALANLDRLYLRIGGSRELAEILERRSSLSTEPAEQSSLGFRLGILYEEILGDGERAIATYARMRSDVDPRDLRVHDALERLYAAAQDWSALVEVLVDHAERTDDDAMRIELLFRAAEVFETHLEQAEDAVAMYRRVLEIDAESRAALGQLDRLFVQLERAVDLLEILERERELAADDTELDRIEFRMGECLWRSLDELERAVLCFRSVVGRDPAHADTRAALEGLLESDEVRLDVANILQPLYEDERQWGPLRDTLRNTLNDLDSVEQRIAALRRAAVIEETRLGEIDTAFETLSQAYRHSVGGREIQLELERLADPLDGFGALAALLDEVTPDDPARAVEVHLKVAEIARDQLADAKRSIGEYRAVLEIEPDHAGALDALEVLYQHTEDFRALVEIIERKAELADSNDARHMFRYRIAELHESALDDVSAAIDTYREVLADSEADEHSLRNLERLLRQTERWPELAGLYEHELGLQSEAPERAHVEFKLARVAELQLEDGERAIELFRSILDAMPNHADARAALEALFVDPDRAGSISVERLMIVDLLEPLYRVDEAWDRLVFVLEARQSATADDPVERVRILREIASIHEGRLEDAPSAFETCARVLALSPEEANNRRDLHRLAADVDRMAELAVQYRAVLPEVAEPDLKVEMLIEFGGALEEQLRDDAAARDVFIEVLEIQPENEIAVAALVRIYTRMAAWEDLVALHTRLAQESLEPEHQKDRYYEVARLLADVVVEPNRAIETWRCVLEIEPDNARAFAALERFFADLGHWTELADLFRDEIQFAAEAHHRATLRHRLGEVLATHLDDAEQAAETWHLVLVEDDARHDASRASLEGLLSRAAPGADPLQARVAEMLEPIYGEQSRWSDWVRVLEIQLHFQEDHWQRVETLTRVAQAHESRLNAPDAAFAAYVRAFTEDYGNLELQVQLDRLAVDLDAWRPLVDSYLAGIGDYDDLEQATGILLKVARIVEERLDEADRAVECYRRALEIDDAHRGALDALERIFEAQAQYAELVEVLERKADSTSDVAEQKVLLYRIGALREDVLDEPDGAIEAYRRILTEDPEEVRALDALVRLYERVADWPSFVGALRERLEFAGDDAERSRILGRIAEVSEVELEDVDEAVLNWRSVLELAPANAGANSELDRLYQAEARWGELLELLEAQRESASSEARDDVGALVESLDLRIGGVLRDHLDQAEQAIELFAEVLRRRRESDPARDALEAMLADGAHRLLAGRVLEEQYVATEEHANLARVREALLDELTDCEERVELLKALAVLRRGPLADAPGAFETFARAFREEPTDTEVVEALHGLAAELDRFAILAELYTSVSGDVMDTDALLTLNRQLARIYDQRLGRSDAAIGAWNAVLEGDAFDAEALRALDQLYQAGQAWVQLIGILRREIDAGIEEDTADLRFRLGYLLEAVSNNLGEAIDLYRSILWDRPDHQYATEAMERLAVNIEQRAGIAEVLEPIYRDAAEWAKLAILLEMRIELCDHAEDRAQIWSQIAELRHNELDDQANAFEAQLRAFAEAPTDEEYRLSLLRLAESQAAWARLVDAFEAVQSQIHDPDQQIEDRIALAVWSHDRLGDTERAIGHYRHVLEIDPENDGALTALESLYSAARDWSSLADIYRRQADAQFDLDEKKRRLAQLADLAANRLHDRAAAVAAYEEVLDIDEADAGAIEKLEAIHVSGGDWPALYDVLERKSEITLDPQALAAVYQHMGDIARRELSRLDAAADAYEKVLELDPDSADVAAELRKIYFETSEWDRLQDVLVKQLTLAMNDDAARIRVLGELGDLAEIHLDNPDSAIEYFRQILSIDGSQTSALRRLEELYSSSERWFDLVEALREHLETLEVGDPSAIDMHVRIATIAEGELHDLDLAISHLNLVLELDDHHVAALTVLARLYDRSGEWEKCAEVLERAVNHAKTSDDSALAQRSLGLMYLDRLDRPEDARVAFEAAVEANGDGESLERLLTMAREREDLVEVRRLLELRLARLEGIERVPFLVEIAAMHESQGDVESGLEALAEAHTLDASELEIADRLIATLIDHERGDEAEPILLAVIERLKAERKFRKLFTYNYQLGRVAEARGDDAAALKYYTECFDYDATFLPNLMRLGQLHVRQETWDKALRIFQTMLLHQMKLKSKEERVSVFYNLGLVRLKLGDARKARDMFARALSYDPDHGPSKAAMADL